MRQAFPPLLRRAFLVNFSSDLSFSLLVHFPGYLKSLGAGEAVIGSVAAVASLAAISVRPYLAKELDRRGRKRVIIAAAALRVLAACLYLTISGIGPWVFVVRSLYVVGSAVTFTGIFTYAGDVANPDKRTQGLALFGLSGMIPGMFGAALGDFIISTAGFVGLFVTAILLDATVLISASILDPMVGASHISAERVGFLGVAKLKALTPIWAMVTVFGLAFGVLQTFMRTFIDTIGIGTVGLFFFCYSATAVVLRLTLSSLPDRIGFRRVLYPAAAAQIGGLVLLASTDRLADLVLAGILAGAGHAFMFPILSRLVVERSPANDRGSAMSLFTVLFDAALLAGGPLLGLLIELAGYGAMFSVVAGVVVMGGIIFARLEASSKLPSWGRAAG